MQIGALIAAAGKFEAMEEFRPLMKLGGTTLIQKEIDTFRQAGISPIVVVTGYRAEELERHLAHRGVVCLRNEQYSKGEMLDSIKLGLSWLESRCSAVLFLPADAPLFSVKTLERVLASKAQAVIPVFEGRTGHPILIRKALIPGILAYKGDFGLRGALAVNGAVSEKVNVEDPGILLEAGSQEEYRQLLEYEKELRDARSLRYRVRLTMEKEDVFFGPGTAELLQRVDEKGSLLSACKDMNMSYSKGWKKIKEAEDQMGFSFLEKKAGGADGGNSRLTEKGRAFLTAYLAMQADVERSANAFFHLYFDVNRFKEEGSEE